MSHNMTGLYTKSSIVMQRRHTHHSERANLLPVTEMPPPPRAWEVIRRGSVRDILNHDQKPLPITIAPGLGCRLSSVNIFDPIPQVFINLLGVLSPDTRR
ncbi:hypothetical protein LIA77_03377 [Sarocladium implicatum]|nr:hypothetical protein LIA77_03377 [Sarocladium implicatum]